MALETARRLSNDLAGIVQRAGPAVVRVEARRRGPSSGVAWSPDVVVTASHTVEWDEDIRVGLPDGGSAQASVVGRDGSTDLAALRLERPALAAPAWKDPDALHTGDLVLALSRPGRTVRAALGVVHARGPEWRTPARGRMDAYVESSVPIRSGFSGGLVVDAEGAAVGLANAGILRSVSLVVPAPTLRRVVAALLEGGRVRRGYLGIGTQPARLPRDLAEKAGQRAALLVLSVGDDTPAATAGVLFGDALLSLDGRTLEHPVDLLELLDEESVGKSLSARLLRAGEVREVTLTPRAREE